MSNPPSSSPALRVDEQTVEEMRHHVRRYLIVGVALAIGTVLTVWASLINFGSREINIVVALSIAACSNKSIGDPRSLTKALRVMSLALIDRTPVSDKNITSRSPMFLTLKGATVPMFSNVCESCHFVGSASTIQIRITSREKNTNRP